MTTAGPTSLDDRHEMAAPTLATSDWFWLGYVIIIGLVVYLAYLFSHDYPAYAGGLFLVMADQISQHGYRLPTTIPYYTETGVPFGYPPFMFYVTALARNLTGAPLIAFSTYVPGAVVVAYLIPYYGIALKILGSARRAGLATALFAVTATTLRWHLSSGGLVRAPAMLFALFGVFVGLKLFLERDRRWLPVAVVLFGLVVLTHPTYSVFFGLSYLVLYGFFDRSRGGLLVGSIVAVGGLALAAPWWVTVSQRHGADIFMTASGTHSGLGGGLRRLVVKLGYSLDDMNPESIFYALAYAGGIYSLRRGEYFLPTWAMSSSYFIGKNRFMFVAGSMLSVVLLLDYVLPKLHARVDGPGQRRTVEAWLVAAIVVLAAIAGALTGASALGVAHENSPSQPQPMDEYDREAMGWIKSNTDPEAEFAVLGDPGEWLPHFAERTIVLGPWGWEWKKTDGYYREIRLFDVVSTCGSASCISVAMTDAGRNPDYVYVPTGRYTVRGRQFVRGSALRQSMIRSERYELVYENDGVMIFEVHHGKGGPGPMDRGSTSSEAAETGTTSDGWFRTPPRLGTSGHR